jgi:hypothetical protein
MRLENFLKNVNREYLLHEKQDADTEFVYFFRFSNAFFRDWGEIWQLELWKNNTKLTSIFQQNYNISTTLDISLQIETELGKTFLLLPNMGKFNVLKQLDWIFPHRLNPETPLFSITRTKAVRRRTIKNEMSSMQQDPF